MKTNPKPTTRYNTITMKAFCRASRSTHVPFYQSCKILSLFTSCVLPLLFALLSISRSVDSFTTPVRNNLLEKNMVQPQHPSSLLQSGRPGSTIASATHQASEGHQICELPGDPSLILTTNVDLGSTKMDVMKGETCQHLLRKRTSD